LSKKSKSETYQHLNECKLHQHAGSSIYKTHTYIAVNPTHCQLDTCGELTHLQKLNSTQVNSSQESNTQKSEQCLEC